MVVQKKSRKINWRQIVIHFIAFWFIAYAFQFFTYLFNIPESTILLQNNVNKSMILMDQNGVEQQQINHLLNLASIIRFVGILFAFLVSFALSLKYKWFWMNSVIVLLLFTAAIMFNLSGWSTLKNIFLTPGEPFRNNTFVYYSITSTILFLLGYVTFFWNRLILFINKGN